MIRHLGLLACLALLASCGANGAPVAAGQTEPSGLFAGK